MVTPDKIERALNTLLQLPAARIAPAVIFALKSADEIPQSWSETIQRAVRLLVEAGPRCVSACESDLARILQIDRTTIITNLRQETGLTFRQWRYVVLLRPGLDDILHAREPLKAIALRCGYLDPCQMNRHFEQVFGLTPMKARKAVRERASRFT